jgi:hypothetical protein
MTTFSAPYPFNHCEETIATKPGASAMLCQFTKFRSFLLPDRAPATLF